MFKKIKMKYMTNKVLQTLMLVGQAANWNITEGEMRPYVAGGLLIIQAVIGMIAQYSNPDGTDVQGSYQGK